MNVELFTILGVVAAVFVFVFSTFARSIITDVMKGTRSYAKLKEIGSSVLSRTKAGRDKFMRPATQDELPLFVEAMNSYLAPHEQHKDTGRLAERLNWNRHEFWTLVRRGDDGAMERLGLLHVRFVNASYVSQLVSGSLSGGDIDISMTKRTPKAKLIYVSLVHTFGDEHRPAMARELNVMLRQWGTPSGWIVARPTTKEALYFMTRLGAVRCGTNEIPVMGRTCAIQLPPLNVPPPLNDLEFA